MGAHIIRYATEKQTDSMGWKPFLISQINPPDKQSAPGQMKNSLRISQGDGFTAQNKSLSRHEARRASARNASHGCLNGSRPFSISARIRRARIKLNRISGMSCCRLIA